jgi:hypothetical protein
MRMTLNLRPLLLATLIAGTWVGGTPAATAQVILGLPDEEAATPSKQAASDAVKSNMKSVRKLVLDAHTLITHRRFSPQQARRLSDDLKRDADALRADAAASSDIVTPLAEGAAEIGAPMQGESQFDALAKLETALARYPQIYDDPDWKPLR